MEDSDNSAGFKWFLIVLVCFLVSGCMSWTELKYLTFGKTVEANLFNCYDQTHRGRRGRTYVERVVEYGFADTDGTLRRESDSVDNNFDATGRQTIRVQYLPRAPLASRIAGKREWLAVTFFVITLGFLVYKTVRLWREAYK